MKTQILILALGYLISGSTASAETLLVSNKAASVYQFLPGARADLYVINQLPPTAGHQFESYIQFDFSSLGFTSGSQVESATLQLYTNQNLAVQFLTGFGAPVAGGYFDLANAASAWVNNASLTWANRPASGTQFNESVEFAFVSDGAGGYTDYWINVDVTESVQYWLDNPVSNFGFHLNMSGSFAAAAFRGAQDATLGPRLLVEPIPEPSTYVLMGLGLGILIYLQVRKTHVQGTAKEFSGRI